jgi:ADP-heptose:LPS heptosyltransferase
VAVSSRGRARPTVLVLRALGLGDLLTALPALRALRRGHPEHRIVLATPQPLAALALHGGAVDEVLPAAALAPLDRAASGADVAVNLHGSGPESHRVLLARRPRRLIAFASPAVPESHGGPAWRDDEHEVARWCRLLRAAGIAADPRELDLAPPDLPVPDGARGATILHPGAKDAARRWPVARWIAVARAERGREHDVVVTGSEAERPLAQAIVNGAGLPARSNVAGTTDVLGLAGLVAVAGRVVCGDTGIAHLATALRTPSVVLFGPMSPASWGPPPERAWHRALWHGRHGDPHATRPDAGLLAIGVEEVVDALASLPAAPDARRRVAA